MTAIEHAETRGTRLAPLRSVLRRTGVALLVALALVGPAGLAEAAGRDDLVRQQQDNADRREKLQSDMEGLDEEIVEVHIALEDARAELPVAEAALASAEAELATAAREQEQIAGRLAIADSEARTLETEIAASSEAIGSTRDAMGELARSTYRGENAVSTIEMVLDASSSEDFLRGYSVMETAVRAQTQVLHDLETIAAVAANQRVRQDAVAERIGELKVEADAAVDAADAARAAAEERAAEVRDLEAEMATLSASLETKKDDVSDQIAGLRAENDALAAEIAAIDEANRRAEEERRRKEEERRRQAEAAARANQAAPAPAPAPAQPSGNLFVPPVPNPLYVTSGYGMRWYPITGGYWMHLGVDLRSRCGNTQVSAAGGTVVSTKPPWTTGTSGNQVIVNHGVVGGSSYVTVYNHLSGFAVSPGQRVAQGQAIGTTGATGNVTGCHVHFEVWKDGRSLDPMGLPGFVRSN